MARNEMANFMNNEPVRIRKQMIVVYFLTLYKLGARGSVVVKALCYKPEGRGFETR
jgi:hypothetical protein